MPGPAPRRWPARPATSSTPRPRSRRKKLEAELNAQLAKAEKTIAATKTAAMANVQGIAADTAIAIVERLIGTAPSGAAAQAAVADALKR